MIWFNTHTLSSKLQDIFGYLHEGTKFPCVSCIPMCPHASTADLGRWSSSSCPVNGVENFHLGCFTKKGPHKSPKISCFPTYLSKISGLVGAFFGGTNPRGKLTQWGHKLGSNLFQTCKGTWFRWQQKRIINAKLRLLNHWTTFLP